MAGWVRDGSGYTAFGGDSTVLERVLQRRTRAILDSPFMRTVNALSFCFFLLTSLAPCQETSYQSVASTIEVGTVAVAFIAPKVVILKRDNATILAGVQKVCVLPYDATNAKNIIEGLPSISLIAGQLATSKTLRQERNEIADELTKRGFSVVDCVAENDPVAAKLVLTRLIGGFAQTDLPTFFWLLYAGDKFAITVHGETELMGLARPASRCLPLTSTALAEQVRAVISAAATP